MLECLDWLCQGSAQRVQHADIAATGSLRDFTITEITKAYTFGTFLKKFVLANSKRLPATSRVFSPNVDGFLFRYLTDKVRDLVQDRVGKLLRVKLDFKLGSD